MDHQDREKVADYHDLSAIRPHPLCALLESDLDLSHYELRKYFKGFMNHSIKPSEAFQLVENEPPTKSTVTWKLRGNRGLRKKDDKEYIYKYKNSSTGRGGTDSANKRNGPVSLYTLHQAKGIRHFLHDCKACPEPEKKAINQQFNDKRAATGPTRSTCAQLQKTKPPSQGSRWVKAWGRESSNKTPCQRRLGVPREVPRWQQVPHVQRTCRRWCRLFHCFLLYHRTCCPGRYRKDEKKSPR